MMKVKVDVGPKVEQNSVSPEMKHIQSLVERKEFSAAETAALKLLATDPKRPDFHNLLGLVYVQQQKEQEALPHFEFAVRAESENPHFLTNLGRLYLDLRFMELALPFLEKALALDPKLTSARLAIGKYHSDMGRGELALPYLERLCAITPRDNTAKWRLAETLDLLGRHEEASRIYHELRLTDSHAVQALYYFSQRDVPEENGRLEREIEKLMRKDNVTRHGRSLLHTSLGFLHDRKDNCHVAFGHFEKANQLRSVDFDIARYRAWIDSVIDVFTPDVFAKRKQMGNPSSLPVLVVGMPRSGTTLIEQILASHPQAGGAGELTRLRFFATQNYGYPLQDISRFLPSLDRGGADGIRAMADNYINLLEFYVPNVLRVVDKLPHNYHFLGLAALLCPNAHIIHCSRNPADTCLSCYQYPLRNGHAYSKDLTNLGLYYREYRRLMDHWAAVLPLKMHEVSYERLTADPENEVRKMLDFIGLPWNSSCLNFHEGGKTVRTFSRYQVRNPIHTDSINRWQRYENELKPLLAALGDLV